MVLKGSAECPSLRKHQSERTITRVSRNPTLARNKKRASLEIFCLFSCVKANKDPRKNLRVALVTSDTRVSLVKVLPKPDSLMIPL